ncbi:9207_t:CDS:2 [Funneliformis caledonium]|uniref:9207_t:CDS:1 n=1 Tax=Funneliformis caledonium TaxID=1117310 RepID=A0A9N9HQQ3_9GLOM|nr:9207_t:CDS:2 [Funneliformis caledonium]
MSRYFDRDPSEWNIESFLENCDQKTTRAKLGLYTTCLSKIVKDENRPRREKAQILLDSIKKPLCLSHETSFGAQPLSRSDGIEIDKAVRKMTKDWELNKPIINVQNTFSGGTFSGGQTIGTVGGRISVTKRNQEADNEKVPKRTKIDDCLSVGDQRGQRNEQIPEHQIQPKKQSIESNDLYDSEIEDAQEFTLTDFDIAYNSLDPAKMWTLKSSGRVVEKVIYEYARKLTHESYLHSFIVNDIDVATRSLFSKEEWKEITTSEVKDKPKLEHSHVALLKKYTTDNIKELRNALSEPPVDGAEFDRNLHFDLDFINYAYRGMLFLWEKGVDPFDSTKLEGWYEMCVWGRLIDPAFDNLDINLVRGEGMSFASSDRKNIERSVADRKMIGRKGDGVFRQYKKRLEFGAVEAGRKWEGKIGTKYLKDSLKLCKMLKDMITQLSTECDGVEDLVRQLQVVGVLNGANMIQIITMDYPKGYISRVQRRNVREVAGRLTKSDPLALVLKEILCAKFIIKQTLDIINKKNNVNIEIFLNDSDDQGGSRTPPTIATPPTFTTPSKERTKDVINERKKNNNK